MLTWSYISTFTLFSVALPYWKAWKNLSSFFFHVESVFTETPNNCATSLLLLPFYRSNMVLYLSYKFCSLWSLFTIFPYTSEAYSHYQNIQKSKSKLKRAFDGDNVQFTCQECSKISNYRENLPKGTWKFVRIMNIFELHWFELATEGKYKSFLSKFHGNFKFVRIMEIFELRRFELDRANCISANDDFFVVLTSDHRY